MSDGRRLAFDPDRVEAVCFDLDDTLFDFEQYVRAGLLEAADRTWTHTGRRLHEELLELYFEEGVTEGTFDRLVERYDLPSTLVPDLVEAYHDHRGPLEPYPEAEDVLARLGDRYPLGLVTDGRNGREKLGRLGLDGYFDAVVVTHDQGFGKPDVEAFERVAASLGVEPAAAVYVGDHPELDVVGPKRLGMGTVRLRRGRYADRPSRDDAPPDVEVDRLGAILDLLDPPIRPADADERASR